MERLPYVALSLLLAGCSDEDPPAPCGGVDATAARVTSDGALRWTSPGGTVVTLQPRVRLEGVWVGEDCRAEGGAAVCDAGGGGRVLAAVSGGAVVVRFEAEQATTVEGLALRGTAEGLDATAWLSNGFQSWSSSGYLALAEPVSDVALARALTTRGDAETLRTGVEASWWYTLVGGGREALLAGALSADRWRSWVQAARAAEGEVSLLLGSGATGERVAVEAGASLAGEPWQVAVGTDPHCLGERWARALPARWLDKPTPAEAGWNSWYDLWAGVDEEAVRANAAVIGELTLPSVGSAPPPRIVVDDGWEEAWGDWRPNGKFPSGLNGLARDLKADGFSVGVWLAPLLVHEELGLVAEHPDWFVTDTVYHHLAEGRMRILDVTHPEAAVHLQDVIRRLVGWGYDLLKIDFLFAGTFEGGRHEAVTGMEAYARALSLIREAAGEEVVLLAVGAPGLPSFPWVDSWRLGPDIALELIGPGWRFIAHEARNVAARWAECLAVLCDADPPLLRDLPRHEVEAGVWVVALAGGAFFLSDDLRSLPEERLSWGLDMEAATRLAVGGRPSVPLDLFPESPPEQLATPLSAGATPFVVPTTWRLPGGGRLLLNVDDVAREIEGVEVEGRTAVLAQ